MVYAIIIIIFGHIWIYNEIYIYNMVYALFLYLPQKSIEISQNFSVLHCQMCSSFFARTASIECPITFRGPFGSVRGPCGGM